MRTIVRMLYLLSIVGPAYDIIVGAVRGVRKSLTDLVRERNEERERRMWDEANK